MFLQKSSVFWFFVAPKVFCGFKKLKVVTKDKLSILSYSLKRYCEEFSLGGQNLLALAIVFAYD